MPESFDVTVLVREAVTRYKADGEMGPLQDSLAALPEAAPAVLAEAVEPFRDMPEVAGPVYERIVAAEPDNARALVILANAYWLSGRGPDVVGELATRAIAADATNRGAWHLWALSEGNPRERTSRWKQVSARFPEDLLARANLADNAAALAGAEQDYEALDLAIDSYEELLERSHIPEQREALGKAISTLKGWKF
jgi:tetratricopeptide (TPR) repeat protein